MSLFKSYVLPRILRWAIVIFIGVTVTFFIPRLSPVNPIDAVMSQLSSFQYGNPEAVEELRRVLEDMMGLKENIFVQYLNFWKRLLRGDLGPSLTKFPVPVVRVIGSAMGWTIFLLSFSIFLLSFSTILSWLLGVILGTLATYYSEKSWAKVLEGFVMVIYPIPYYIMALLLLILFAYIFPIFPLFGAVGIGLKPSLSLDFILSALKHAFLPSLSIILVALGWRFMSQKALTSTLLESDFITYARVAGIRQRKIIFYLFRNSLLPQITDLALTLGQVFSGALITEVVFSYPGVGQILYSAILQGDYNLILGIAVFSIIGVATGTLILDLVYPLLDPRIRYS